MKRLLWLDDLRDPSKMDWLIRYAHEYYYKKENKVYWVKSYEEFIEWINKNGLPTKIAFDHDLGLGYSGYDAAKWIIDYCMDRNEPIPEWVVQSSNPVGRRNIDQLLYRYKELNKNKL